MATWKVVLGGTLAGFVAGAALIAGLVLREKNAPAPPRTPRVRAIATPDGSPHLAIVGRIVTLKANLEQESGRALRCWWEFGDGQRSVERPVTDPRTIEERHIYVAGPGARFDARLHVRDVNTGEEGVATYPIRVVLPDTETLTTVMLDDALWALHRQQQRWDHPLHGRMGRWLTSGGEQWAGEYAAGATALAVLSFVVNGYDLRAERAGHPYTDTVERGLDYLAASLVADRLPRGSPTDHGGNGQCLRTETDRPMYEVSLAAMALVGAQAPERRMGSGNAATAGRTARAVVGDLLDYLTASQRRRGPDAGGWHYVPRGNEADLSVSQWPALALDAAEREWGIETPALTKALAGRWLSRVFGPQGGFRYQVTHPETIRMTGAGLIVAACADVPESDPRVKSARQFIAERWTKDRDNVGDAYAMYAVMKAARLSDVSRFGAHDWRAEYVANLALATSFPALTLSKDVFAYTAPIAPRGIAWQVGGGLAAAAALGLGALLRRARR